MMKTVSGELKKLTAFILALFFVVLVFGMPGTAHATNPTGFTSAIYSDNDSNGTVDRLVVVINGGEPLTNCVVDATEIASDWTYTGGDIGGVLASATCDMPSATVTFIISGANANVTGHTVAPTIAYSNEGDDSIRNASGVLGIVSATDITDGVNPALISATTGDGDENGQIDRLTVVYSEPVIDPDYDAVVATGYSLDTSALVVSSFTANPLTGSIPLTVNFTNNSSLNATSYLWDFGDGSTSTSTNPTHIYTSNGMFTASLTATNSIGSDIATETIQVDPSFDYSSGTYCQDGANPTPNTTDTGTFSSLPAGLSLNPSTGTINLATSVLGTYTLSFTTDTGPNTSSISMTIANTTPDATFSYSGSPFSQDGMNPLPVFGPGASGGIFSAPVGLVFANANTGEIDLSGSTPGTYLITNTIPTSGSCSQVTDTDTVTIDAAPAPSTPSNTYIYPLIESGSPDTGVTPALTWTAANATDVAGNNLDTAGAPANATDGAGPVIAVNQKGSQADPTGTFPIKFDVVFSEAINLSTFTDPDITITGIGNAPGITFEIHNIASDSVTFEVWATEASGDGAVRPSINAGSVDDLAGNGNIVSTATDNDVTYDTSMPVTPVASPVAGTYTSTQSVTLSSTNSTSIRYTTDGSSPTCSVGTLYGGAFNVSSTQTIKAIGCNGGNSSSVASFAYTITMTSGGGGSGGSGGGGYIAQQPTATPTPPTFTPIPFPQLPTRGDPANLARYGLREGDVMGARPSGDPDIFIVNQWGYKRLFLNPVIFGFYGHLGGFAAVTSVVPFGRDAFPTSGLFRNCETLDKKVYALEVTGEDTGTLHWVNISGDQAVAQDPDFFKKDFCINNSEFNWYLKSPIPYTSLSQLPVYRR